MLRHGNAAGDNGGAGESRATNSQGSFHSTAESILTALGCGRTGCACVGSVRRGRGLTHCPAHDDRTPSMDVTVNNDKMLVKCHAGCGQDAVIGALKERGLWPAASLRRNGTARHAGREVRHTVRDEAGAPQATHIRHVDGNGKKISGPHWEQPDGSKGLNGRRTDTLPLYGVEHLQDLADGADVVLVEGETAYDALHDLGVASVATVCGAGVTPIDDVLRHLSRFTVYLWPDNDVKGRQHMSKIATRLVALGVTR